MNNVEKYEKIIKENENNMVELWILHHMQEWEAYTRLNNDDKAKLLYLIYHLWLSTEHISIDTISDIVMENYEEALNGEITKSYIYKYA